MNDDMTEVPTTGNVHPSSPSPFISNKHYDVWKWIAQYVLPGLGAFYFALAGIWGLPAAEQVLGTIVALDTLLGILLGYASRQYRTSGAAYDGVIKMNRYDPERPISIEVDKPLEDIQGKKNLTIKVEDVSS